MGYELMLQVGGKLIDILLYTKHFQMCLSREGISKLLQRVINYQAYKFASK